MNASHNSFFSTIAVLWMTVWVCVCVPVRACGFKMQLFNNKKKSELQFLSKRETYLTHGSIFYWHKQKALILCCSFFSIACISLFLCENSSVFKVSTWMMVVKIRKKKQKKNDENKTRRNACRKRNVCL